MTVEQFIAACVARGWHFTANWMRRRLHEMAVCTAQSPQLICPVCDLPMLATWTKRDERAGITCLACETDFLPIAKPGA